MNRSEFVRRFGSWKMKRADVLKRMEPALSDYLQVLPPKEDETLRQYLSRYNTWWLDQSSRVVEIVGDEGRHLTNRERYGKLGTKKVIV